MAASVKANEEYEWEFVDPSPIEFDCPICHNVLREPNLTTCCGSHFCQACIEPIVREGKPCPNPECNEREFSIVLDKSVRRKIFGLDVRCPMWRRGCNWNGELAKRDEHLDVGNGNCRFVDVDCSKGCGRRVQRRELPAHLEQYCPKRRYACNYCGFEEIYEVVSSIHWPVCEKFPLSCPNECGVEKVERCHFEQHLRECPLQEVECEFSYAGCTAKVCQQDLQQHMDENILNHMRMMSRFTVKAKEEYHQLLQEKHQEIAALQLKLTRIEKQKDEQIAEVQEALQQNLLQKNQQLTDITAQLHAKISALETRLGEKEQEIIALTDKVQCLDVKIAAFQPLPFRFSMTNFSQHKAKGGSFWSSPDFYLYPKGYKMHTVVAAASDVGVGLMSVYVSIKHGEFDDELTWPLKATIALKLIDVTGRLGPYERTLKKVYRRVIGRDVGEHCSWRPFIKHAELENYLKNDTLNFQVIIVPQ